MKELREKIDDYFVGKLSKKELGQWAGRAYNDLLKGGYVETEKIVLYPFLKNMSTFHLKENDIEDVFPCTEESIKEIQDIVCGKTNWCFDVEISIPIQVYTMFKDNPCFNMERRNTFIKIQDAVIQYSKQKCKFENLETIYVKRLGNIKCPENTVQELLEERIFKLMEILYDDGIEDAKRKTSFKLFPLKSGYSSNIEDKLLEYLDSYIGNKSFHLIVSYKNGAPDIFLLI